MLGVLPPKYVRAINFINASNDSVNLNIKFKSGVEVNIQLLQNENKKVEKDIDLGTFTNVDPIVSVRANHGNIHRELAFHPQGVEIHTYKILNEGNELNLLRTDSD